MSAKIGFKLDLNFETNRYYKDLFGEKKILEYLKSIGIDSVETAVGPETSIRDLAEYVAHCCEAGMRISVHPYSERTEENCAFFTDDSANPCRVLHENFFRLASGAQSLMGGEVIVNIHGAATNQIITRQELLDKTIQFFSWAVQWCETSAVGVVPVAELQIAPNRDEEILRIGDTFEELEVIADKSGCLVCWDFGHATMNKIRFASTDTPSEKLLPRVAHVHCHDVNFDDHHPLLYNLVPWRDYLHLLKSADYKGTIVLEIPALTLLKEGGLESLELCVALCKEEFVI